MWWFFNFSFSISFRYGLSSLSVGAGGCFSIKSFAWEDFEIFDQLLPFVILRCMINATTKKYHTFSVPFS